MRVLRNFQLGYQGSVKLLIETQRVGSRMSGLACERPIENLSVLPQRLFIKTPRYSESLFNININNDATTTEATAQQAPGGA